jgi:hypothetical protein
MAALLMNLLFWLSWFSGSTFQFTAVSGQEATAQKGFQTQPGRLPLSGSVIKPTDDVVYATTIVLEDDTHFRPFFNIKK